MRFRVFIFSLLTLIYPITGWAQDLSLDEWLSNVMQALSSIEDAQWHVIVGAIITLLIAALRVSAFSPIWEKLGKWKGALAVFLGLIGSIAMFITNQNFSWVGIIVAVINGGIAIGLAELCKTFGLIKAYTVIMTVVKNFKFKR